MINIIYTLNIMFDHLNLLISICSNYIAF